VESTLQSPRPIRFAAFEVDLRAGELRKNGIKLKLSGQPFQVLAILLERRRPERSLRVTSCKTGFGRTPSSMSTTTSTQLSTKFARH
jgi:hypothetical protein